MSKKEGNELLEKENAALKKANKSLTHQCHKTRKQLEEQVKGITASKQYSRNCNDKRKRGMNLGEIVCKLGTILPEPLTPTDTEVCHRAKTMNRNAQTSLYTIQE